MDYLPFYPKKWRSPEEYNYESETEKVDVFSMGNVLFFLLTGRTPWGEIDSKEAAEKVKLGKRPKIDKEIRYSEDPYHVAMVKAIGMCFEYDQKKRTGARAVADVLDAALKEVSAEPTS